MAQENETIAIDLNSFHQCIETWIPNERTGYRLYINEQTASSKPSSEYILTEYSWKNQDGVIHHMGEVNIRPETPSLESINSEFENAGLTPLSEAQWRTVKGAYENLTELVLEDQMFEGVPQLYKRTVYHEIPNFQKAMEDYIDDIHTSIEGYENHKDDDKDWYDAFENHGRLGDDQYHHIGEVFEAAIDWEHSDVVPYAQHCQIGAILEFDSYEEWEIRTLEHLHNGILINKPELAKTKALLENGLTQSEIAEKLGKDPSTVSRQVASINALEDRAEWTLQQNNSS